MDMDYFDDAYKRSMEHSGVNFGDVTRLVVRNGLTVRLIGTMAHAWEHFVETAKGKRPVYCQGPESECPICELVATWSMSDDESVQAKASDMKAKERFYFNALDRSTQGRAYHNQTRKSYLLTQSDKSMNVGAQLLQAIGAICAMRKEQGKPNDPNGFDIMLTKTGAGMQTKYGANFTGDTDELTEDELSYELYDLKRLAALTPQADVEAMAAYLRSGPAERAQAAGGFDTNKPRKTEDPKQVARAAMGSAAPPAASPPPAKPAASMRPAAAPAPARPAAPAAPPPQEPEADYADTAPSDDFDPTSAYQVPCGDCGVNMQISFTDTRDLKCHGCGKIYGSPNGG